MSPSSSADTLLACIWYRVAERDRAAAIEVVREFQRGLGQRFSGLQAQVLLRCELPSAAAPPDATPDPVDPPGFVPAAAPDAEATLMETYRLALPPPAGHGAAQAAVRAFLFQLDTSAAALAPLLRGARHAELFAPCAS